MTTNRAESEGGGNGAVGSIPAVPEEREFEDTGKRMSAAMELVGHQDIGSIVNDAIKKATDEAVRRMFEGGNGGPPGAGDGGDGGDDEPKAVPTERHVKSVKRHNQIAVLLCTLLGPGGAGAVVWATSDLAKTNEVKVQAVEKKVDKDFQPRLEKVEENVQAVKDEVAKVTPQIEGMKMEQTAILTGITELKQENLNRLKAEKDRAEREKEKLERQLERERRRRGQ